VSGATLLAMLLVGGGFGLLAVGLLARTYGREEQLAEILDLPYGEQDVDIAGVIEQHSPLVESTIGLAGKMVDSFDAKGTLLQRLERARIPLRPGEFVLVIASAGVVLGAFVAAITDKWVLGLFGVLLSPLIGNFVLNFQVRRRKKRFEAQFPDALSLIASSLSAGHTFLRSIQMMCEEAEPPLAEEFARVVNETQLGDPLVDALDRMASRLDVRDVAWVVQAIRIQQTVGGKLADLLHTLADFIRAREEIRREVGVLTAEGRMSAYVLGALPVFLMLVISVINPRYMEPMYRGWGPIWLGVGAVMVAGGVSMIMRMVKSVEV
jgi:tight adherence protein B